MYTIENIKETKMEQEILKIITKYIRYDYKSLQDAYIKVGKSFDLLLQVIEITDKGNVSLFATACSIGK